MRLGIYNFLVNRHPGIKNKYHAMHDHSTGLMRYVSHLYLLWMNFAYYVLFIHSIGKDDKSHIFEVKNLETKMSESEGYLKSNPKLSVDYFVSELSKHEVISFDIFDTLILRPFCQPTDLFYVLGSRLEFMDFTNIRMKAEWEARLIHKDELKSQGIEHIDYEVSLSDIWKRLHDITGLDAEWGMELEKELELDFCYANPFMKQVYDKLREMGKRIVITTDMYLPKDLLTQILEKNGYTDFEKIFVSNEYHKSKSDGKLFSVVKDYLGEKCDVIHVGDNLSSDVKMAKKAGFSVLHYPNVNADSLMYRAYDMSPIVGGAYRGLVNNRLYNGATPSPSMEYEFGYIYGGLFVLGYCSYIHDFCGKNGIDKVLFLSRDGDILHQVYQKMYPTCLVDEDYEYVYWSRKAATVLCFDLDRNDYYRRFLYHKINQGYSIRAILKSMELSSLASYIEAFCIGSSKADLIHEEGRKVVLHLDDELTTKNVHVLRTALDRLESEIRKVYENRDRCAKTYYSKKLSGYKKVLAVDIGWAGSGAIALRRLVRDKWQIPCKVFGMIAGSNTVYNAEPYQSETFFQTGVMNSYLFSMSHNRDLMKRHNPNMDYNVYWELLLSSPTRQFVGFCRKKDGSIGYDFGSFDENLDGICDIQKGILDFCSDYMEHFHSPIDSAYFEMYNISGRDAYAPMVVASSHHEKYLRVIERRFHLEPNVV
ncbi:MAG: HAD-IA family hydrolase [Lachnospiraceae bacterium]|nr:HAD-IA family hydrolase [Lachnospiraceae bacterium]